jgi:hypothetical protein
MCILPGTVSIMRSWCNREGMLSPKRGESVCICGVFCRCLMRPVGFFGKFGQDFVG